MTTYETCSLVIPAKAGIQIIQQAPHCGTKPNCILNNCAGFRPPHLNPPPKGEEAIALSPYGGKLDRGLAGMTVVTKFAY